MNNCTVRNITTNRNSGTSFGIFCNSAYAIISNVTIKTLDATVAGGYITAIEVINGNASLSDIIIDDIDAVTASRAKGLAAMNHNSTYANCRVEASSGIGVHIVGDNNTFAGLYVEGCTGTGIDIATTADRTQISSCRSTNNGTNFTDSGTNSTYSVEET